MILEAFDSTATLVGDGSTQDWEKIQAVAELMMDELPLKVESEWEGEYITLNANEQVDAEDIAEAYEDAYIKYSLRDRAVAVPWIAPRQSA